MPAITDLFICQLDQELFGSMVQTLLEIANLVFPCLNGVITRSMKPDFAADQAICALTPVNGECDGLPPRKPRESLWGFGRLDNRDGMKRSWQIESSSGKGLLLAVGSLLVGILFIWLTSRIAVQDSNTAAAMWLGVLLAGVGLAGIIFDERIVTTVDTEERCLRLDCRRRWGGMKLTVPFDEVVSVNVAKVGSRSDGTPSFWLQIERPGGKVHSTGRWSTNEAEIRRLAERLAGEIGCECQGGSPLNPASAGHVVTAALGAVVLYAAWFRFSAGPWCPAMWFGNAPPVFILAGFALLLGLLRRFS